MFSTFDWKQLAKIREHGWNERLKISKCVKFESDLFKTNEDRYSFQESRNFSGVCIVELHELSPYKRL